MKALRPLIVSVVGLIAAGSIARAQQLKDIYDFGPSSSQALNGSGPESTLIEAAPGLFYGTSQFGGANNCGVLFTIASTGAYTKLYDFPEGSGCAPTAALVQGADGALYGLTGGTVYTAHAALFRSDLKGNVTTLVEFPSEVGSQNLTAAVDGSLYLNLFTVSGCGGGENCIYGQEIKHYTMGGKLTSVVKSDSHAGAPLTTTKSGTTLGAWLIQNGASQSILLFEVSPDSFNPVNTLPSVPGNYLVGLTEGADGRLYFLTDLAAFSTTINGSDLQLITQFGGVDRVFSCETPQTGLTLASDGALYGGCYGHYPLSSGTIFRISDTGTYSEPYIRPEESDGSFLVFSSESGLAVESLSGTLFGEVEYTEDSSAPSADGFIYALDLSLPKPQPVIQHFDPSGASTGASVLLLGNYFLGTTSVTFNGVPAKFAIRGNTYLRATVPAGATSGPITVTNANGTTSSTGSFLVD